MLNKISRISKTSVHIPFLMHKLSKVYLDVQFENGTVVRVGKGGILYLISMCVVMQVLKYETQL